MVKTKSKTKKLPSKTVTARKPAVKNRVNTQGSVAQEGDSMYILKLVLYLILGSQWLRISWDGITIPLPIGLIIGLLFAHTERYPIDRKIQYAILLLSMFIGFWLPIGLEIVF